MSKLRVQERRKLQFLPSRFTAQVNKALERNFDREFIRVSTLDQLRLLALRVWMEKYKVSLDYILQVVVPFCWSRTRGRYRSSRSLGIRIATLVGQKSEKALREQIAKDFDQGENISIANWERLQSILQARRVREDGDVQLRAKTLSDYQSVQQYVKAYRTKISNKQFQFQKELNDPENLKRHYRTSPWNH